MSGYYAKVTNISGGKSCVATSAYMSREKLKDEQMNHSFNYSGHEHDNTFSNVTLCKGAPEEWQDKEKLWNAVEAEEKGKNTRKAKQWILAVPQKMTEEQTEQAVKEFQSFLAEKGMCSQADVHEPDSKRSAAQIEKNKHVHVLATQRKINEQGKWEQIKEKKVYANYLDAEGKPAYNPDIPNDTAHRVPKVDPEKVAEWEKRHEQQFDMRTAKAKDKAEVQKIGARNRKEWERVTIQDNPFNKKEFIEESRAKWAEVCNKHLSAEQQIDHRSYERQGIDKVSEIHEGIGYHQQDERAEYNKAVQELNSNMDLLKKEAPQELEQIRSEVNDIRESLEYDTVSRRTAESDQRTAGADQSIESPARTTGNAYVADRAGTFGKGNGAEERNLESENSDQKTASRSDTERRYRSGDRELAETMRNVEEYRRSIEETDRAISSLSGRIASVGERIAGIRAKLKDTFENVLEANIRRLTDALKQQEQARKAQQQPKESIMARLNRLQQVNQENREKQEQDKKQTEQSRTQAILERAKQANEQQRAETAQNGTEKAETDKRESIRDKLQRATEKAQAEREQPLEREQKQENAQEQQTFHRRRGTHR